MLVDMLLYKHNCTAEIRPFLSYESKINVKLKLQAVMNGTQNPRNSGTHATRERLAVLRLPTRPPPRRWLSSGCIVIFWNERCT